MAYDATQINKMRRDIQRMLAGQIVHSSATTLVTAADATSDGTLLSLCGDIRDRLIEHFASVVDATSGAGAHLAADTVSVPPAVPVGLGEVPRFLAGAEGAINGHVNNAIGYAPAATVHFAAARDASHFARYTARHSGALELFAWANAIKAAINAHVAAAMNSPVAT